MNNTITEQNAIYLKRLAFRSHHRGWKEADIILGKFADKKLAELTTEQLVAYEKLLDSDDNDIWNWLTDKETPPDNLAAIIDMLRHS